MDCQNTVNLMSRYIDNDLEGSEKELWKKHMNNCKGCAAFFESFQSSLDLVEYLEEKSCPMEVKETLETMIVEMAKKKLSKQ